MTLYYTRNDWGARHGTGSSIGRVGELIVHHSYRPHVPATATHAEERAAMRSMERFHAVTKGWSGIGYQFLVFQSGRGYEGRGWFRSGAHTKGRNSKSVGICFVINGDEHEPTDRAWAKARQIIADGIAEGALTADYILSGHADYSAKSCPGDLVYPIIGEHLSPTLIGADIGGTTEAPEPNWLEDIMAAGEQQLANIADAIIAAARQRQRDAEVEAARWVAEVRVQFGLEPEPESDVWWAPRLADGRKSVNDVVEALAEKAEA